MTTNIEGPAGYAEALTAFRAGDVRAAADRLGACSRADPAHIPSRYGLAQCYERLGEPEQARAEYREILGREPGNRPAADRLRALTDATAALPAAYTVAGPATLDTLAGVLAAGPVGIDPETLRGAFRYRRHRALLSHRRLFAGAGLLAVWPVLYLLERSLRAAREQDAAAAVELTAARDATLRVLDMAQPVVLLAAVAAIVAALLSRHFTTYTVYQRHIDVSRGLLYRQHRTVWLYSLIDVQVVQDPLLVLTGTGTLLLSLDPAAGQEPEALVGFGSIGFLADVRREVLAIVAEERWAMKRQFI